MQWLVVCCEVDFFVNQRAHNLNHSHPTGIRGKGWKAAAEPAIRQG
jgi:hypothetical protein